MSRVQIWMGVVLAAVLYGFAHPDQQVIGLLSGVVMSGLSLLLHFIANEKKP